MKSNLASVWTESDCFAINLDTNQVDLASQASVRQVMVVSSDLNTNQANLPQKRLDGK